MARQRNKNHAISRNRRPTCTTIFTPSLPGIKNMFEITLKMDMRQQRMLDCYDIIEQSACLTQASKFYIALTQPCMICNGNRFAACRVSVNAPSNVIKKENKTAVCDAYVESLR